MKYSRNGDTLADSFGRHARAAGRRPFFTFRGKLAIMMAGTTFAMLVLVGLVMMSVSYILLKQVSARGYELLTANAASVVSSRIGRWERTLADEAARMSVDRIYSPDAIEPMFRALLSERQEGAEIFNIYFISEDTGVLTSGTGRVPDTDVDFRTRDYYRGAAQTQETYFSPPYVNADTDRPVITMARAIRDGGPEGRIVGVLAMDISISTISRLSQSSMLPKGSYCFLVDDNGAVIDHPNEIVFGVKNAASIHTSGIPGYDRVSKMILDHHDVSTDPISVTIKDYDGTARTFYAHHTEGGPWHLISAISGTELDGYVGELFKVFIMIGFAVMITAAVASYLASTAISYSLNDIIDKIFVDMEELG